MGGGGEEEEVEVQGRKGGGVIRAQRGEEGLGRVGGGEEGRKGRGST